MEKIERLTKNKFTNNLLGARGSPWEGGGGYFSSLGEGALIQGEFRLGRGHPPPTSCNGPCCPRLDL